MTSINPFVNKVRLLQSTVQNSADLIDFHCHLDLFPNHLELIRECEEAGIKTLTVTNAPRVFPKNQLFVQQCHHVRVALGLHPQLAHQYADELHLFEEYLPQTRYVGEVGLDGSPEYTETLDVQRKVFQKILKSCASAGGKVLTVHSRRAASEVIEMININLPVDRGRVVLHWFTGSLKEAERAITAGCYFSVNLKMMESERRRALVKSIPRERILTESDGPFVKFGHSVLSPKDIGQVIKQLAILWSIEEQAAAFTIRSNLRKLLTS